MEYHFRSGSYYILENPVGSLLFEIPCIRELRLEFRRCWGSKGAAAAASIGTTGEKGKGKKGKGHETAVLLRTPEQQHENGKGKRKAATWDDGDDSVRRRVSFGGGYL